MLYTGRSLRLTASGPHPITERTEVDTFFLVTEHAPRTDRSVPFLELSSTNYCCQPCGTGSTVTLQCSWQPHSQPDYWETSDVAAETKYNRQIQFRTMHSMYAQLLNLCRTMWPPYHSPIQFECSQLTQNYCTSSRPKRCVRKHHCRLLFPSYEIVLAHKRHLGYVSFKLPTLTLLQIPLWALFHLSTSYTVSLQTHLSLIRRYGASSYDSTCSTASFLLSLRGIKHLITVHCVLPGPFLSDAFMVRFMAILLLPSMNNMETWFYLVKPFCNILTNATIGLYSR